MHVTTNDEHLYRLKKLKIPTVTYFRRLCSLKKSYQKHCFDLYG